MRCKKVNVDVVGAVGVSLPRFVVDMAQIITVTSLQFPPLIQFQTALISCCEFGVHAADIVTCSCVIYTKLQDGSTDCS